MKIAAIIILLFAGIVVAHAAFFGKFMVNSGGCTGSVLVTGDGTCLTTDGGILLAPS